MKCVFLLKLVWYINPNSWCQLGSSINILLHLVLFIPLLIFLEKKKWQLFLLYLTTVNIYLSQKNWGWLTCHTNVKRRYGQVGFKWHYGQVRSLLKYRLKWVAAALVPQLSGRKGVPILVIRILQVGASWILNVSWSVILSWMIFFFVWCICHNFILPSALSPIFLWVKNPFLNRNEWSNL